MIVITSFDKVGGCFNNGHAVARALVIAIKARDFGMHNSALTQLTFDVNLCYTGWIMEG